MAIKTLPLFICCSSLLIIAGCKKSSSTSTPTAIVVTCATRYNTAVDSTCKLNDTYAMHSYGELISGVSKVPTSKPDISPVIVAQNAHSVKVGNILLACIEAKSTDSILRYEFSTRPAPGTTPTGNPWDGYYLDYYILKDSLVYVEYTVGLHAESYTYHYTY